MTRGRDSAGIATAIRQCERSDLQGAQVRDAGAHEVEIHFDEIVFDAGGFRGGEDLFPVERVLANGSVFFGLQVPALNMHGEEAAGILGEVFSDVEALRDGGNLKLELDEFGVEEFE